MTTTEYARPDAEEQHHDQATSEAHGRGPRRRMERRGDVRYRDEACRQDQLRCREQAAKTHKCREPAAKEVPRQRAQRGHDERPIVNLRTQPALSQDGLVEKPDA